MSLRAHALGAALLLLLLTGGLAGNAAAQQPAPPGGKSTATARGAPGSPAKTTSPDIDDEQAPLTDEDFKRAEEAGKRRAEEAAKKKAAEAEAARKIKQDAAKQQSNAAAQSGPAELTPEQRLDEALEHYYAKRYPQAAAQLFDLYRVLPETDLKRDTVAFFLAESLGALGFAEASVEHHVDIVMGRRSPDLVMRSLSALDRMVRARLFDESRLIDEVLFGSQFGDLPPDVEEFVEYYQGLGELRRGFGALGARRLEALASAPAPRSGGAAGARGYYAWKSRYALAVDQLARKSDEGAEKQLRAIVDDEGAPRDVRNDARTALARQLYEQKHYPEAFDLYARNDAPLTSQDVILVEKAWAKVGARDEQRALGMVVGLGAPVYKLAFSPERWLIRATSLDRLCQFRAAHVAVDSFRRAFAGTLRRIRERGPLGDDPVLRPAALSRADLVPAAAWRARIVRERGWLPSITDAPLRGHLGTIYETRSAQADAAIRRTLDAALDVVADELLMIDEQMTILDYEIGVGLFKGVTGEHRDRAAASLQPIPYGSDQVFHRFDGEYWSDEIQDFQVRAEDRCLR